MRPRNDKKIAFWWPHCRGECVLRSVWPRKRSCRSCTYCVYELIPGHWCEDCGVTHFMTAVTKSDNFVFTVAVLGFTKVWNVDGVLGQGHLDTTSNLDVLGLAYLNQLRRRLQLHQLTITMMSISASRSRRRRYACAVKNYPMPFRDSACRRLLKSASNVTRSSLLQISL